MSTELKIELSDLPRETMQALISASNHWGCTPSEAAERILNDEAAENIKLPPTEETTKEPTTRPAQS